MYKELLSALFIIHYSLSIILYKIKKNEAKRQKLRYNYTTKFRSNDMGFLDTEKLVDAVIENNIDLIRNLLENGTDPNGVVDANHLRPLHFAAQNNGVEAAKLLLAAGADVTLRTEPDHDTPYDIAKLFGHKAFMDLLLRYVKTKETNN